MQIDSLLQTIKAEEVRNQNFLHLTANENQMSKTASQFLGSKLAERYFMGGGQNEIRDFGHFTGLAHQGIADLISAAEKAACQMLGAASVNLSVLSGVHAMMSTILATTEPGEMVMTVPLENGGHFATKGILERVGRGHIFADYNYEKLQFDVARIAENCQKHQVKAIYLDVSYYLNPHNLRELRQAVGEQVIIIYDASHTMGLIMGQQFQNPFAEGADVICANTHKTLPGPHKGMIAFRDQDLADKANSIINGCLYSSPHLTHLIALSVAILEMQEFGQEYAKQIIANSNALGEAFAALGYQVRKANTSRYSENHQTHVFLHQKTERLALYRRLIVNQIVTNFENTELTKDGQLYMRLGTAEVTRRGMKEVEMKVIAKLMDRALSDDDVKKQVQALNEKFQKIHYSFDS